MSDEAQGAVLQLLEDSWEARERTRASRRELLVETAASLWFLAAAGGLALAVGLTRPVDLGVVGFLVLLYALVARVEFPVGSGYVVPTQLVLLPMLVLLPPAVVAPAVAVGLVAATGVDAAFGRVPARRLISAVPDAWHALGAATVLALAGSPHLGLNDLPLMAAVFAASCLTDLASSMLRMAATGSVPKLTLQVRVMLSVWAVDGCLAPLGFAAAVLTDHGIAAVLLVTPLAVLLWLLARDRQERVHRAHERLKLVQRERARLQSAVRRLGDAFAARLQLDTLLDILLHGAIEALDATGGQLDLSGLPAPLQYRAGSVTPVDEDPPADRADLYTAAVPMRIDGHGSAVRGELGLERNDRAFDDSELGLLEELVAKAAYAASAILATEVLREQAVTDALTGLGNRRRLGEDLDKALLRASSERPVLLLLFDLDGFKSYNDTFGHLAGDQLLTRLGARLSGAVADIGSAYRLGGDEFCVLLERGSGDEQQDELVHRASAALVEQGDGYTIGASVGSVLLPHEADRADHALQLADQRMYGHKRGRKAGRRGETREQTREQTREVLLRLLGARQAGLEEQAVQVADLAGSVARALGLRGESVDEVVQAAELRDVGNVGIPDAILAKNSPLDPCEWDVVRQHTTLGEQILTSAPALRPVASLVRATHERWDGSGYPDRLAGTDIPLGARIIAVCDAYVAMTAERPHRPARPPRAALNEVTRNAGTQFDPTIVTALCAVLDVDDATAAEDRTLVPVHAGGR